MSVVASAPADDDGTSMKRGNVVMTSSGDVITLTTYIDKDDNTVTGTVTIE